MNFWAFKPSIFDQSLKLFEAYARENIASPKAEFFIPLVVSHVTSNGPGNVKVFESDAKWFGVTYQEDKPFVKHRKSKRLNFSHSCAPSMPSSAGTQHTMT